MSRANPGDSPHQAEHPAPLVGNPHPSTPHLLTRAHCIHSPAQSSLSWKGCKQGHGPCPFCPTNRMGNEGRHWQQPHMLEAGACHAGLPAPDEVMSPLSWVFTVAAMTGCIGLMESFHFLFEREVEELLQPTEAGSTAAPQATPCFAALPTCNKERT